MASSSAPLLPPGRPRPRSSIACVACVATAGLAWIAAQAHLLALPGTLRLALLTWVAFPVVLLTGSVIWERVPAVTATMHAGDWLLKLLLAAAVLGLLH
jgi:hypothetical protein